MVVPAVALGGCALLLPQPYGEAVPDAEPVTDDGGPITMPARAPSIMNGYWADYEGHAGIDVVGDVGRPVLAPADGVVAGAWFEPMYGHNIVIDHGALEDGTRVRTRLVHLDARAVATGDRVARGQAIGALGRTGLLSGGIPHLHFEVQLRRPGRYEIFRTDNPHRYWVGGPGVVTCYDSGRHYADRPFRITYPVRCAPPRDGPIAP
jgi:murein DD-endopeptidase MepM/ murein hydrolase activator NlpD